MPSKVPSYIASVLLATQRPKNAITLRLGAVQLSRIKKQFIKEGKEWPVKPLAPINLNPRFKGHKWQRLKPAREATIAENMAKMPQMIADHRQQVKERKQKYRKRKEATKNDPNQPQYIQALLAKGVRLSDIVLIQQRAAKKKKALGK